jgi:voltage-gated potassium channel
MRTLREQARTIIFESDTPAGFVFDVTLIVCILVSVGAVLVDSLPAVHAAHGAWFYRIEWFFTVLFTLEYAVRLWCIREPWRYARSFYGIVDLLGVLPTYFSLVVSGSQYLLVIRVLRVLRVFRVLRMFRYVREADTLTEALRRGRRKVTVFFVCVLSLVVIFGSIMYVVEGPEHGFTSIPESLYWAIVTLTTVGYGDIAPSTGLGRLIASLVMITGYAIIAVPTGIFAAELSEVSRRRGDGRSCPNCSVEGHSESAAYCWRCGHHLRRHIVLPGEAPPN